MMESFFVDWKEDKKSKSLISSNPSFASNHASILGVQPQTFMNLSGDTIRTLVSFYKLDPKTDILVVSDDIDMEFGKVRFRTE